MFSKLPSCAHRGMKLPGALFWRARSRCSWHFVSCSPIDWIIPDCVENKFCDCFTVMLHSDRSTVKLAFLWLFTSPSLSLAVSKGEAQRKLSSENSCKHCGFMLAFPISFVISVNLFINNLNQPKNLDTKDERKEMADAFMSACIAPNVDLHVIGAICLEFNPSWLTWEFLYTSGVIVTINSQGVMFILPGAGHGLFPLPLVPGISCPWLSTHQQTPLETWHCEGL